MKSIKLKIDGMHCTGCEKIIEEAALSVDGVKSARSDYAKEETTIEFDENKTQISRVIEAINGKGYKAEIEEKTKEDEYLSLPKASSKYFFIAGAILLLLGLFWVISYSFSFNLPEITPGMGLALIFIVGLVTGFHCVGMCGGFVLSYTTKDAMDKNQTTKSKLASHIKYGIGKTITYALLGALFGLLGSFIAFTPKLKGIAAMVAGLFLIVYGLNMMNVFPWLRKLQLRSPKFIGNINKDAVKSNKSPFIIGLLNGLMIACGPLQAMLIYAAGTGSLIQGATSMIVFGIGTLPLMLGFGSLATIISHKTTRKIVKVSSILVIVLGLIMINRGLTLTGSAFSYNAIKTGLFNSGTSAIESQTNAGVLANGIQEINMDVDANGWKPDSFVLKKGIPVRWNINVKELTSCNKEIIVDDYKLDIKLKGGMNIVEFTPDKAGTVRWSCWMGMIPGTFIVTDSGTATEQQVNAAAPKPSGGTCGMSSGGGCGCGG